MFFSDTWWKAHGKRVLVSILTQPTENRHSEQSHGAAQAVTLWNALGAA
jgi:hypothetical protein